MSKETKKIILDACCGGRMMWFDKNNPNAVFIDKYPRLKGIKKERPNFNCTPDIVMDFTKMDFLDKSFKLVIYDPPHLTKLVDSSMLAKQYGILKEGWQEELSKGFDECWRVLDDDGVLIFKWNQGEVKYADVIKLFSQKPLFGHPTGKIGNTMWFTFMKLSS